MNKIVFDGMEIEVISCFPMRYENGKEVLTITINGNVPFEEIKKLDGFTGTIAYFENEELKTEYTGYSANFSNNYRLCTHNVELTRVSASEIELQKTKADLEATASALQELIFMVMEGRES